MKKEVIAMAVYGWYVSRREVRETMVRAVREMVAEDIDLRMVHKGLLKPGARERAIEVFMALARELEKGGRKNEKKEGEG